MDRSRRTRLAVSVLAALFGIVGAAPGAVMAKGDVNPCTLKPDPIIVTVFTSPVEFKPGAEMDLSVTISNCTAADWNGSVRLAITAWSESNNWCVTNPDWGQQSASVSAGDTRRFSFRGPQPECVATYIATATAFDTIDRATGFQYFAVYTRTPKPGP